MAHTPSMDKTERFLKAYDELSDAIFRHCYFRVFSRERALELAQETFTKTWAYLADGGEVRNFRAFLYQTARNLIVDESRKKKTFPLDALEEDALYDSADGPARRLDRLEGRELMQLLAKIPPLYREAVRLRYVDDLSPKEIALITGESENNVSVRINRGIKKLRELLPYHAENI